MGWGPVDWVGRVLPEAKFEEEKKWTSFFYLFLFERLLLRYLLKSVLHRAALLHCLGLLAAVWTNSTRKDKVNQTSQCIGPAPVGRLIWQVGRRFQSQRPLTNFHLLKFKYTEMCKGRHRYLLLC